MTDYFIKVPAAAGGGEPSGAAGGDLGGTYPNPTVAKVNATTVTTAGGALATGAVLRVTGVASADWGAVNLADTDAVTGTLPKANQGAQDMAGDVTGSTAVSVVEKINGATVPAAGALTTSHVAKVSGASALTYGFVVNANVDAAAAIAGSKIAPDFGAQNVVTTGVYSSGTTPATAGNLRLPTAASISARNNANGANLNVASTDASDIITYGGTANAGVIYGTSTGAAHNFQVNGTTVASVGATYISVGTTPATAGDLRFANNTTVLGVRNAANSANITLVSTNASNTAFFGDLTNNGTTQLRAATTASLLAGGKTLSFSSTGILYDVSAVPATTQTARSTDAATATMSFTAQAAWASATGANLNGAPAVYSGGARGSTSGKRGPVRIQINGSTSENMVECCDVQAEATKPSRVVALVRPVAVTTTEMPSDTGDLVIYIGNCAVAPSANPASGGILYVEAGALKYRGSSGTVTTLGNA